MESRGFHACPGYSARAVPQIEFFVINGLKRSHRSSALIWCSQSVAVHYQRAAITQVDLFATEVSGHFESVDVLNRNDVAPIISAVHRSWSVNATAALQHAAVAEPVYFLLMHFQFRNFVVDVDNRAIHDRDRGGK